MATWFLTIRLGDKVQRYKDGDIDVNELATLVTEQIKASSWRSFTADTEGFDSMLAELEGAQTEGAYNAAFERIYDLADLDRVWIETW